MHSHFNFSAGDILWTLTFAALLVLLVVLLGRDRARRYPWFTAVAVMMALRMVSGRLLAQRLAPIVFNEIFLGLYDLYVILLLGLAVEIARRAFRGASRVAWIVGTLLVFAVGGVIVWRWGPWPAWKTLTAGSQFSTMRLMQLFAQKTELLADLLFIQIGLLVAFFGRSCKAGWRSHTQQIAIGLSTTAIAEAAVRLIWQQIATHTTIHTQAEYAHVMGIQEKLYNSSNAIYLIVLLWWIACLWVDEPGSVVPATAGELQAGAGDASVETASASNQFDGKEAPPADSDKVLHEPSSQQERADS
jgi:hypothetical protein